jgi:hypothetical protein
MAGSDVNSYSRRPIYYGGTTSQMSEKGMRTQNLSAPWASDHHAGYKFKVAHHNYNIKCPLHMIKLFEVVSHFLLHLYK